MYNTYTDWSIIRRGINVVISQWNKEEKWQRVDGLGLRFHPKRGGKLNRYQEELYTQIFGCFMGVRKYSLFHLYYIYIYISLTKSYLFFFCQKMCVWVCLEVELAEVTETGDRGVSNGEITDDDVTYNLEHRPRTTMPTGPRRGELLSSSGATTANVAVVSRPGVRRNAIPRSGRGRGESPLPLSFRLRT